MKAEGRVNLEVAKGPEARTVERMFSGIARRYDFLNHFLSASIDRRWRKIAVARLEDMLGEGRDFRCLDLCTGTADLAIELGRGLHGRVVASDFCHPMIARGVDKIHRARLDRSVFAVEADALVQPFANASFHGLTIGFGLRNLEDRLSGLREMLRLLKPGGALVVLEFSRPERPVLRQAFGFYFRNILPRVGSWISGNGVAYRYLHDSATAFPAQEQLAAAIRGVGFQDVGFRNLSGGIAALHWGRKPVVAGTRP